MKKFEKLERMKKKMNKSIKDLKNLFDKILIEAVEEESKDSFINMSDYFKTDKYAEWSKKLINEYMLKFIFWVCLLVSSIYYKFKIFIIAFSIMSFMTFLNITIGIYLNALIKDMVSNKTKE